MIEPHAMAVSLDDVIAAGARLAEFIERTPMLSSESIDATVGRNVWLKCESLQRTGSFKVRGALNALLQLPAEDLRRGVMTESSGNFGLGLAWASRLLGVQASIVMPSDAAAPKRRDAEAMGATVHLCAPTLADRARVTAEVSAATGAIYVSPHDDVHVIAGQGTVALEATEQVPAPESCVVPVGGGGLIAGVAIALKALWPGVRVIGVQPAGAADAARSKAAGRRIREDAPQSVARGLLVNLGDKTWPIVDALVDDVVVVDDSEIVDAMRLIWERARLVVEPSAAVTVAALASSALRGRVGDGTAIAILSGGNVDLDDLPWEQTSTIGRETARA